MSVKIGIPRALLYYSYFPLWNKFYEELGAEVIVSKPTTKRILNQGTQVTVDEACLPVKLFHGHVIELVNKVDFIFIPRIISVRPKEYICPKLMGLPDMVKASIKNLPPIISTPVDLSKTYKKLEMQVYEAASPVTKNRYLARQAFVNSLKVMEEFRQVFNNCHIPDCLCNIELDFSKPKPINILLLGHPYNLYDSYTNMDVLRKLDKMGIRVITPEMIPCQEIERVTSSFKRPLFWSFGKNILGSLVSCFEKRRIDGVIHIVSFGCGPDSMVGELAERWTRRTYKTPFMFLTIDEHTGEAGFNTRLEAFIDLIERKRNFEADLPAYGKSSYTY